MPARRAAEDAERFEEQGRALQDSRRERLRPPAPRVGG